MLSASSEKKTIWPFTKLKHFFWQLCHQNGSLRYLIFSLFAFVRGLFQYTNTLILSSNHVSNISMEMFSWKFKNTFNSFASRSSLKGNAILTPGFTKRSYNGLLEVFCYSWFHVTWWKICPGMMKYSSDSAFSWDLSASIHYSRVRHKSHGNAPPSIAHHSNSSHFTAMHSSTHFYILEIINRAGFKTSFESLVIENT